jgi:hypothetical protein
LSYFPDDVPETLGGWRLTREEKFARLVERGLLNPGDELIYIPTSVSATISDDFGLIVSGIRYSGPSEAAAALGAATADETWALWRIGEATLKQVVLK